MSSRNDILDSIRRHTTERFPLPDLAPLEAEALTFADPVAQFTAVMPQVGGRAVVLAEGQSVGEAIAALYPAAARTALAVDSLDGVEKLAGEVFHADSVDSPRALDGIDLAIAEGSLGVCENGAVWVEQRVANRAVYFLAEALVLLLPRHQLVNNMHEAYRRLGAAAPDYGVFISGPSKTADIEQALVLGAHGARDVTVILT